MSAEDSILARLKAVMAPTPVYDIETAPDGDGTGDIGDADFRPFCAVIWGGPIDIPADRGIISTRLDLKIGYVMIRIVTPDAEANRILFNKMLNGMTGFVPEESGELIPNTGMQYSNASNVTQPTRFYREIGFSYRTNTAGMGDLPVV